MLTTHCYFLTHSACITWELVFMNLFLEQLELELELSVKPRFVLVTNLHSELINHPDLRSGTLK